VDNWGNGQLNNSPRVFCITVPCCFSFTHGVNDRRHSDADLLRFLPGGKLVSIRRERRGKRYFNVARDDEGKVLSTRLWRKDFRLKDARRKFRNDNTFKKNISILTEGFTRVDEITDTRAVSFGTRARIRKIPRQAQINKRGLANAQWVVIGFLNKKKIAARSSTIGFPGTETVEKARNQAWESFLARLAEAAGLGYDPEDGALVLENVKGLREGFVYYRRRKGVPQTF
jgi:hypothetical protein